MRIISGSARGLNLKSPRGEKIRPTSQKVKAAFFNILHERIYEADFLDLFAGSGAVGLEALSRGAKKSVFVDKDIGSVRLIHENIRLAKMQEKAAVYHNDASRVLSVLSKKNERFNIIYIDPPYLFKDNKIIEIFVRLQETGLAAEKAIIGVERPNRGNQEWELSPYPLQQKKSYGDTALYLFEARE